MLLFHSEVFYGYFEVIINQVIITQPIKKLLGQEPIPDLGPVLDPEKVPNPEPDHGALFSSCDLRIQDRALKSNGFETSVAEPEPQGASSFGRIRSRSRIKNIRLRNTV
jgi:hypothetical protein